MFHNNPAHTGYTTLAGPKTNRVLWSRQVGGRVVSSPAVANGVVYIGSWDYNVYALDAENGSLIWSYNTGNWVVSSPAVANGVVYVAGQDGGILWAFGSLAYVVAASSLGFVESGFPLPVNGTLIVNANYGDTAVVRYYANSTLIGTEDHVELLGNNRLVNCSCETSNLLLGNYSLAIDVLPENGVESVFRFDAFSVTYVGDLTGDFKVDFKDIVAFNAYLVAYQSLGEQLDLAHYPALSADLNHDGKIDISDIKTFADGYITYLEQLANTGRPFWRHLHLYFA